jgi:hypothetical protein
LIIVCILNGKIAIAAKRNTMEIYRNNVKETQTTPLATPI